MTHLTRSIVVIWVNIFKTEITIEIQLVRLTEVCGKVLSEKNAYKSVKVRLRWFGADLVKLQYLCHLSWDLNMLYIK